ncbi:hypothetical protein GPEL0_01r4650 [Geoanaerobacter pelophilus]|uniref:Uncharacterized protein n=1 Tax=Geoanaerobacter pelophilus TaxID=60036 RepID=A0ABQ0MMP5_9BACT|nr:hypothetical protein GPEL0_01r4650 [Geoanaerobacter pelophilus]
MSYSHRRQKTCHCHCRMLSHDPLLRISGRRPCDCFWS